MAEMAKKLHFLKNGTEQTAKAYSTTGEAGSSYIPSKIDGVACYIPIGATDDAMATNGRVIKGGTEYAIKSQAMAAYTEINYTTPGTYTFTVPSGVYVLKAEVAGGGGGGGGGTHGDYCDGGGNSVGGAGGQGELQTRLYEVSPNQTLSLVVGAGGVGGQHNADTGNYEQDGWDITYSSAEDGYDGESSVVGANLTVVGGGGGGGGYSDYTWSGEGTEDNYTNGSDGQSRGNGGAGGTAGGTKSNGGAGGDGWINIAYGGDLLDASASSVFKTEEWTTPGTYSFTVPDGVKLIEVEVAGGGGGGNYDSQKKLYTPGTDGNRNTAVIEVTPGTVYEIVAGSGGASTANGSNSSALGVVGEGGYGSANLPETAVPYYGGGTPGGGVGSESYGTLVGGDGWVKLKYWEAA